MIQPNYAQQPIPQAGGANAVAINIFNPQAYGAANPQQQMQQVPYDYTNSLYQMPQVSAYNQQGMQPGYYQQYMQPMMMPQQPTPMPQQVPVYMPQPEVMPESVITPQAEAQAPVVEQTPAVQVPETVNSDELIQQLTAGDVNQKAAAINKIAEYVQGPSETALQLVSEPVMNALISVINEDTSALEGPTDKQIEIADKIAKGTQLTPEEEALAEQLSPRDAANKNRIFAMYTLAMIQKLQRDELNQYIETQKANGGQAIEPLKIQDLAGFNDYANIINNDAERPELKVAAIQSLQHVAEPQDKEAITGLLQNAQNSQDEAVKQTAADTLNMFNAVEQPAQAA